MVVGFIYDIGNAIRLFVMTECFFCVGFFLARLWVRRGELGQYLTLMAASLILYSTLVFFILLDRLDKPISWRAPLAFCAVTIATVAIMRVGRNNGRQD